MNNPTRQKARTICPCFLVSRSGSTETNTDAIGRATIAIPPRAFPKARRAAYKSRHSDQTESTDRLSVLSCLKKWFDRNKH